MAELKTQATNHSVNEYLDTIEPAERRPDALAFLKLFEKVTGEKAQMWGPSIVGFGKYHYKSERSTQEGDWPLVAFAPRKQNFTLYIMHGNTDEKELLEKLGKYKVSGSCLHIKKLSDVDQTILAKMINNCFEYMKQMYPNK